jgi:hypothetical protein
MQSKSIQSQRYALEKLAAELATASKTSGSLKNQEKCAKQAQEYLRVPDMIGALPPLSVITKKT